MTPLATSYATAVPSTRYTVRKQLSRLSRNASSPGPVVRTSGGSWRIDGTRVSLDSIICAYQCDMSVESIVESFPSLSPRQVQDAIAFYLSKKVEIDQYLEEQEARWKQFQDVSQSRQDPLLQRMRARSAIGG
jgi:uncharacterized protein (DUF433 family)